MIKTSAALSNTDRRGEGGIQGGQREHKKYDGIRELVLLAAWLKDGFVLFLSV